MGLISDEESLTRAVLAACDQPFMVLDDQGRAIALSHGALKLLNLSAADMLGANILPLLGLTLADLNGSSETEVELVGSLSPSSHPKAPRTSHALPLTYRLGISKNSEEGGWRWLLKIDPFMSSSGEVCDIESHFRAIVETITDSVIIIDELGIIQLINPAVEKLFGYTRSELVGQNINRLMPSPDHERHDDYLRKYSETGIGGIIGQGREVHARAKDGTLFPVHLAVGELAKEGPHRFVGILHDLSPRRETEQRLTLLSSAVEQAPAGILIADLQGNIEYVNAGFSRLTGYDNPSVIGGNLFAESSVMTSIARNAPLCWRLLSVREWRGEITDHKKTGESYSALVTFSPIQDRQGNAIRLLGRFQDITRQKADQEALAQSEARFSEVARMVGEWLWEQDAMGRYTYSSDAVMDILGYRPEDIIGKHYLELMTEEDQQRWAGTLPTMGVAGTSFHRIVNHYLHRDGHAVFTESTGAPLVNERGEILFWRGVDLDITERKRVEDAVRLRERAIEAASVGIAIADARQPDFPNIYVNSALCKITGYTEEELLGKTLRLLQGRDTEESARDTIREALLTGHACEVVIRNYRKDGAGFWNELMLSPVHDEHGALTHYIGVITDISERRRAEDERHELEIARQIQMSLLPKAPLKRLDVEVAGVCIPAAQVGGDYYDFICHGECIDLVIADVSGHSVGAALIMAEMRSTLKAELRRTHSELDSIAHLLGALNEVLYADLSASDLFITMFYLRYNRTTRQLRFASAGHNPPLLLRHSAPACEPLDAEGLILGVRRHVDFEEKSLTLEIGDRLMLYTDGVTETQNEVGEFFESHRLCQTFTAEREHPPEDTLQNILVRLREFRGGGPFLDDITMVSLIVN